MKAHFKIIRCFWGLLLLPEQLQYELLPAAFQGCSLWRQPSRGAVKPKAVGVRKEAESFMISGTLKASAVYLFVLFSLGCYIFSKGM